MDPGDGVPGLQLEDVPTLRLKNRVGLLEQVDRHFAEIGRGREPKLFGTYQDQAFDILINGRVRSAFDVSGEPETLRRRYGMSNWNQLLLMSRRLVEAGVRLVHVNWVPGGPVIRLSTTRCGTLMPRTLIDLRTSCVRSSTLDSRH
ncbi:MAG: hypothetical protein CM1200mP2_36560 [Planctomycetaceae bacterium]|nr:MAG: hypothetical protein CM1200mP2_36560 [Planctomycetaceae bacterium]